MNPRPKKGLTLKTKEISDSMTLEDLEEQLKVRMLMEAQLEDELPNHHKQIANVIQDLSRYYENQQYDESRLIDESGKIDPSKNYFVRMALGSDVKWNGSDKLKETEAAEKFWTNEQRVWLINHLRQFDARVEKWKSPESKKLQSGELDPADLNKVLDTLREEKSQLLKKCKGKIVESPNGEISLKKDVRPTRALDDIMGRLRTLNDFVSRTENDMKGECPVLGTFRAGKSLRYARNMHDQLEILKTKLQPPGRQPFFTTGRNGINKMINLVDKKIPDSQRRPDEKKKAAPGLMERLRLRK